MKRLSLFFICFTSYVVTVYAEKTSTDQAIIFCPETVECDSTNIQSCHLSDNPSEIWGKPVYHWGSGKLLKGTYRLKEVLLEHFNSKPSGWPQCQYFINDKQPAPMMVTMESDPEKKYSFLNYLSAYAEGKYSNWVINYNAKCLSDNPRLCPMVEAAEITTLKYDALSFYYPNPNSDWDSNFIVRAQLTYEELFKLCGPTSSCILDIGYCEPTGTSCSNVGTVNVDISKSETVKINQVSTDQVNNPWCNLKKKEPFNTIYCEPE